MKSRLVKVLLGVLGAASVTSGRTRRRTHRASTPHHSACLSPVLMMEEPRLHGVLVERHGRLVGELYRKGPDLSIDVLYGLWLTAVITAGDYGSREIGHAANHLLEQIVSTVQP